MACMQQVQNCCTHWSRRHEKSTVGSDNLLGSSCMLYLRNLEVDRYRKIPWDMDIDPSILLDPARRNRGQYTICRSIFPFHFGISLSYTMYTHRGLRFFQVGNQRRPFYLNSGVSLVVYTAHIQIDLLYSERWWWGGGNFIGE